MGCDCGGMLCRTLLTRFQSTHPVWDATEFRQHSGTIEFVFQSTHPVWDATEVITAAQAAAVTFQSTHPVWDATCPRSGVTYRTR